MLKETHAETHAEQRAEKLSKLHKQTNVKAQAEHTWRKPG